MNKLFELLAYRVVLRRMHNDSGNAEISELRDIADLDSRRRIKLVVAFIEFLVKAIVRRIFQSVGVPFIIIKIRPMRHYIGVVDSS